MSAADPRRLERARRSLDGLSLGDAFGERFFTHPHVVDRLIDARAVPAGPWGYTDDTVMGLSIVDVLEERGAIDRDRLAELFGARYQLDPGRGYGGTAHGILERISLGEPWQEVAPSVFGGGGSMGNGGAMRSAPVGAWFADDLARAANEARLSAEPTHAHPEGQCGAIAVAVAAAWVAAGGTSPTALFEVVLDHTPDGATRAGVEQASQLALDADVRTAVGALGNGSRVISEDTVPFCVWQIARALASRATFEDAMWSTVAGLGDRDTTCAIVGGVYALRVGVTLPDDWIAAREGLDRMSRSLLGSSGTR